MLSFIRSWSDPIPTEIEREQAELRQLRDRGDLTSQHNADRLEKVYHVRQMDGLSQDVYQAARGDGHSPEGWTRLSEHPELLEKYAAQLHKSAPELLNNLRPDESGFRAEIYLPDAALQQAGYKPTLAFKGSSGEVMTSNGDRHDTTAEDFGANNFPQSVGLRTDYYDRAMELGNDLKRGGMDFESTGHSLAGGMAAAVAAVTDTHATTLNAAGLNPITTARFAHEHPRVVVAKDLNHLVTNYQVQGELLSDGIQNNIHNLDALRRQELGATLKETCDVLQRVPEAKDLFAHKLASGLPPQAQQTVHAFVDKVATGNTDQMLRELPLAAGEQHVLAAMTRDAQGNLVPRVQVTSLPETTRLATPLLESLAVVSAGARLGERSGEVVAAGGHVQAQALHAVGRGVDGATGAAGTFAQATTRFEGKVVQSGEHLAGATLAHVRIAQAEIVAQVDQGLGQATRWGAELDGALLRGTGHLLPEHAQHALQTQAAQLEQIGREAQRQGAAAAAVDRHAGQVDAAAIRGVTQATELATSKGAETYGAAQHAIIGGAGHGARAGLDATAHGVEGVSQRAPAAFGAAGAAAGLGLAAAWELNPANYPRLAKAATAIGHGKQTGSEAFERHLLAATVTPSLDAHIQALERQANLTQQHSAPAHSPAAPYHAALATPGAGHSGARLDHPLSTPGHATPTPTPTHAPNDPRSPENPRHAQYEKTKELVAGAYARHGMSLSPEQLERTTAGVMLDAQKRQLKDIKDVQLNPDPRTHQVGPNSHVLAFSGNPQDVTTRKSITDVQQTQQASPEQSYQQLGQVTQQQTQVNAQFQAQQAQINAQAQPMVPGAPGMGGR